MLLDFARKQSLKSTFLDKLVLHREEFYDDVQKEYHTQRMPLSIEYTN